MRSRYQIHWIFSAPFVGAMLLFTEQASAACPRVEGTFNCTSTLATVLVDVQWKNGPNGTVYVVKDQDYPADDVVRTKSQNLGDDAGPSVTTLYKTSCLNGDAIEFLSQGQIRGRDGTEIKVFAVSKWTVQASNRMTIATDMRVVTTEGEKKAFVEFKCTLQE